MLSKSYQKILSIALPIIGGMISQNILNLVDTAMVGQLGDEALAGVGLGGFLHFLMVAFITTGLGTGVQTLTARKFGEKNFDTLALPLNGGLCWAIIIGVPSFFLLYYFTPQIFQLVNSDPKVIEQGVPYLHMRLLAMVCLGMNFCFRGYWNGINQPKIYLRTIIIMHVLNVIFSYALIFGKFGLPELGTQGAGLGTSISVFIGFILYFFQTKFLTTKCGFLNKIPKWITLKNILKLSIPTGMQQVFFAGGFTVLFSIIGMMGTSQLAAAQVLVNIMLVTILPGLGFGLAANSLVSQAVGRKDLAEAYRWGIDTTKVGTILVVIPGVVMFIFAKEILSLFIVELSTLQIAIYPLKFFSLFIIIEAICMIIMHALFGVSENKKVMVIAIILQWGFFLPLSYVIGIVYDGTLLQVWILQGVYRSIQAIIFCYLWKWGSWRKRILNS